MRLEGCARLWAADKVLLVFDVYARVCQRGEVVRAEGIEAFGVDFHGAVAAQQAAFEEDTHLRHHGSPVLILCGGNFDAGQEIFLAVGAQLSDGELRAGDDNGFAEVFEHETQGRGCVGHRVRAVQQHEAVVGIVMVGNDMRHLHPVARFHVAGIYGRVEGERVNVIIEAFQFGHVVSELLEVEVFERAGLGIFDHADGPARVDDKDVRVLQCIHSAKLRRSFNISHI